MSWTRLIERFQQQWPPLLRFGDATKQRLRALVSTKSKEYTSIDGALAERAKKKGVRLATHPQDRWDGRLFGRSGGLALELLAPLPKGSEAVEFGTMGEGSLRCGHVFRTTAP